MTEPLPVSGYGDADWVDLENNWRDADATWVQERSVVRINVATPSSSTPGDAGVANFSRGRIFFNDATGNVILSTSTSSPYVFKTLTASSYLSIKDGASTSELKATAASDGTGISINNTTGAVSIGAVSLTSTLSVAGATTISGYLTSLKAGSSGTISTSSDGLTINTSGSNAVVVTTSTAVGSATTLEVSSPVKITGSLTTTTGASIAGALSVTGASSLSSASVSSTLSVTGTSTLGTLNAGAVTASSTLGVTGVLTANGTVVVGGTNPSVLSATGKDLILNAASSQAIRTTSNFYYGASGSTTKNAWVIYQSSGTPTVGDYPEGTIWIS